MTSLANNPKYPDITVDFVIRTPTDEIHHVGSYNLSNDVERRATTERFQQCLVQGYTVTTTRGVPKKRAHVGTVGDKLRRAVNDHGTRSKHA